MNEFNDVRDLAAGTADELVTDERLAKGRTALLEALANEKPHHRAVRTRIGFGIGAGLVAAATVTGIVLANVQRPVAGGEAVNTPAATAEPTVAPTTAPTPTPQPTLEPTPSQTPPPKPPATVDTVITAAAAASAAGAEVPDGMYRQYTMEMRAYVNNGGMASSGTAGWLESSMQRIWASAAPRPEWPSSSSGRVTGEWWGDPNGVNHDQPPRELGERVIPFERDFAPYVLSPQSYPDLPRDPRALLDTLASSGGEPASWTLLYSLTFNVAPADLRVAMWEAVKTLPDSELLSSVGDIAVIEWRDVAEPGKRMQLTIDTSTGYVVQTDWWWGREEQFDVPTDISDLQMKITNEIVDAAPEITW